MDPNVLARFVVPRPLNNFLDNLPSEERLAADGPWTLVEPTSKLLKEVRAPCCASALSAPARPLRSLNAGPGHSTLLCAAERADLNTGRESAVRACKQHRQSLARAGIALEPTRLLSALRLLWPFAANLRARCFKGQCSLSSNALPLPCKRA
jgi:hypothetical protein